jgi:hypothetical protein
VGRHVECTVGLDSEADRSKLMLQVRGKGDEGFKGMCLLTVFFALFATGLALG